MVSALLFGFLFSSTASAATDCSGIDSDVHRFHCQELVLQGKLRGPRAKKIIQIQESIDNQTEAAVVPPSAPCRTCGYRETTRLEKIPAAVLPAARPEKSGDTSQCSRTPPNRPKRIIIGFDGLGGYSALNKALMERGSSSFVPFGGMVIRSYIHQAVKQDPMNTHWEYFNHLSSSAASSSALRCIQALATTGYRGRDGKMVYPTVTVVGHSFGGAAAHDLVSRLNSMGIAVDLVVTADARARNGDNRFRTNRSMTGKWLNFEQQNDFLPGYSVAGASNYNLSRQGANHISIPSHPTTQYHFKRHMSYMPSCKPSFSQPVQDRWANYCP